MFFKYVRKEYTEVSFGISKETIIVKLLIYFFYEMYPFDKKTQGTSFNLISFLFSFE